MFIAHVALLCRYPGDPVTYRVVMDCVDVDLLTMCQVPRPLLLPAARAALTILKSL